MNFLNTFTLLLILYLIKLIKCQINENISHKISENSLCNKVDEAVQSANKRMFSVMSIIGKSVNSSLLRVLRSLFKIIGQILWKLLWTQCWHSVGAVLSTKPSLLKIRSGWEWRLKEIQKPVIQSNGKNGQTLD